MIWCLIHHTWYTITCLWLVWFLVCWSGESGKEHEIPGMANAIPLLCIWLDSNLANTLWALLDNSYQLDNGKLHFSVWYQTSCAWDWGLWKWLFLFVCDNWLSVTWSNGCLLSSIDTTWWALWPPNQPSPVMFHLIHQPLPPPSTSAQVTPVKKKIILPAPNARRKQTRWQLGWGWKTKYFSGRSRKGAFFSGSSSESSPGSYITRGRIRWSCNCSTLI